MKATIFRVGSRSRVAVVELQVPDLQEPTEETTDAWEKIEDLLHATLPIADVDLWVRFPVGRLAEFKRAAQKIGLEVVFQEGSP